MLTAPSMIITSGSSLYELVEDAVPYEGVKLLNERMGYVADSRAERDVKIYTNSKADLPYALARTSDKEMAIDAVLTSEQRKELIHEQRAAEVAQQQAQARQTERQEQSRGQRPKGPDFGLSH